MCRIIPFGPHGPRFQSVTEIYRQEFIAHEPEAEEAKQAILVHKDRVENDGFIGLVAVNTRNDVVGFVYGYESSPKRTFQRGIQGQVNKSELADWFCDCLILEALAVVPAYRRQSIGTRLHNNFLERSPYETALLVTGEENERAQQFYEEKGWKIVSYPIKSSSGEQKLLMGRRTDE